MLSRCKTIDINVKSCVFYSTYFNIIRTAPASLDICTKYTVLLFQPPLTAYTLTPNIPIANQPLFSNRPPLHLHAQSLAGTLIQHSKKTSRTESVFICIFSRGDYSCRWMSCWSSRVLGRVLTWSRLRDAESDPAPCQHVRLLYVFKHVYCMCCTVIRHCVFVGAYWIKYIAIEVEEEWERATERTGE